MKTIKPVYWLVLSFLAGFSAQVPAEGLMNLRKPDTPRFTVTDIDWPAKTGEASICLWKDDKLAAFSYGIDDNCASDVPWWLEQTKIYNLPITWFLVTKNINGTDRPHMNGKWELWQKVVAEGHAIESHSVNHLSMVGKEGWLGTEWEYSESRKQIEDNVPGWKVFCIAYPGGPGQESNDPDLAAKHYLAGRIGIPSASPANEIDYLRVNASSTPYFRPIGENPSKDFANFNNVFQPSGANKKQYRGWAFGFSHYVGTDDKKKPVLEILEWYKEHSGQLWGGLFRDVARYGQERDTAKLTVDENDSSRIAFTLTDKMDDRFYDYPLTVKVRLPDSWTKVKAAQNGKEVEVKVVEKDGAKFALVQAVPDRGQTVISPKS